MGKTRCNGARQLTFVSFKEPGVPNADESSTGADVKRAPGPYDPEHYKVEKILGARRPNGELNLKKLKPIHRKIIAMHCRGLPNRDIAFVTGLSEVSIGRILRDPLSQEYINQIVHENVDMELSALGPLAIDAVRQGLLSEDQKVALVAADRFFRATGRYDRGDTAQQTAEDVIKRALELAQGSQELARDALASRSDGAKVIEGRFTKLPDND